MRSITKGSFIGFVALFSAIGGPVSLGADAGSMDADLHRIASEWARIEFQVKDADAQDARMKALADEAASVVARYPDRAEPLIWDGVVTSSEAGMAGPFDALGLAERARDLFEKAGQIDFKALNGAVPTSLGALYYKVPGFPLGFGDDKTAERYFEQAVEIDPNGLDVGFYYGDFLFNKGAYPEAAKILGRALKSPVNQGRPVWDAGRRAEIRALLAKVEEKIASSR